MSYSHINTSDHKKVSELSLSHSEKLRKWFATIVTALVLSGWPGCTSNQPIQVGPPKDNGAHQTYYGNTPRIVAPLWNQQEWDAIRRLNERQQMIWQENAARERQVRREREYHEYLRREQAVRDRALREQWEREKYNEDRHHHDRYQWTRNTPTHTKPPESNNTTPKNPGNNIPKKRIPYPRDIRSDRE